MQGCTKPDAKCRKVCNGLSSILWEYLKMEIVLTGSKL